MSFQTLLAASPADIQPEITKMDTFIKSLHPLKFKRSVDKRKINYVSSDYGISYAIFPVSDKPHAAFGWYFLHNRETGEWYRKPDYFVEVLTEIAKDDPAAAKRIYAAVNACTSCKGNPCTAIAYSYEGEDKSACYGRIKLPLDEEGFADAQTFFQYLNTHYNQ